MVHHVIFGSLERFMAVITEHFAGKFPFWLAPVQVGVVPVHNEHEEYANGVTARLRDAGFRVNIDTSDGTMGNKIKNFRHEMLPYIIIVGDKEVAEKTISLRSRSGNQINNISLDGFLDACKVMESRFGLELFEEFSPNA